ncbi:VPLPA-CTERM sorting domain-containing protein [Pseudoruegeria sp. HB172150]|uniref:VPLPA-CTERM sorting domain-containing protein n=1 Tax=Pseudoruegeria sp. HB172150 TaxID=2721164 RepID=UPI0015572173|nr:VPLPA-CTERM sorting domain-containing protein [Pseudoruegeria sp. HB172150]
MKKLLLAAACLLANLQPADAVTVTDTRYHFCHIATCGGGSFDIDLAVPTKTTGPGLLSITAYGDFGKRKENVSVFAEGKFLGTLFNNRRFDDIFFGPDRGRDYGKAKTTFGFLSQTALASLISDGVLKLTFVLSKAVGDHPHKPEFIKAGITFDEPAAVPLPSGILLGATGLGALGLLRRRRNARPQA